MTQNIKNIVILGTSVVFIFVFWGMFQVRKDHIDEERATFDAYQTGRFDAHVSLSSNNLKLMAESHHWGGGFDIPGLDSRFYDRCLSDRVELVFYKMSLTWPDWVYRLNSLKQNPHRTIPYALAYNKVMINYIEINKIAKCI